MAFRTSSVLKLRGASTPQPLFGSWIADLGASTTGAIPPLRIPTIFTLGNACTSGNDAAQIFIPGEPAWLVDPSGANPEPVRVSAVSGNTLTLGPQTYVDATGTTGWVTHNAHVAGALGTGTFIIPKQMINNLLLTFEDGATGPFLYVGNSPVMTSTLWRVYKLAVVSTNTQPYYFSAGMFSAGNPFDLSELFVMGAINDQWNVSLNID